MHLSTTDLWSNPKLPFLELIPGYDGNSAPDKWLKVPDASNVTYSSLTGVMVAGLRPDRSSNLSIQSSYFNLRCSDGAYFAMNYSVNLTEDVNGFYGGFADWLGILGYNPDKAGGLFTIDNAYWNSFMVDTNWNFTDHPPPRLNQSHLRLSGRSRESNCSIQLHDRNVTSRSWHRLRSENVSRRSHAAISHRHSLPRFDTVQPRPTLPTSHAS